jgi:hypothetical protein
VVRETWEADFDYFASSCPQGVFNLTCHPQVIGRGGRLAMYEEFIKHVNAANNVRLETLGSFVDRGKSDNPLPQWKR